MQTTINRDQVRAHEYERYAEMEYQRRETDELTEASEKLAMVMHNSFEFEMREDGELYFQDGSVGDVLRNSVAVAEEIVQYSPQFMTELIRRRIELQEYDEQRRLALGSESDPDVLVVLSPIPDAVIAGVDLGAYDKSRKKTLARIYTRTETGILSTSLSLDGTDRAGLQAIARQFNQSIHETDGSEDILAMRFWGYSSVLHDPVKTVRRRYDEQLERQFGGEWYAGRQDGNVVDALTYIKEQKDIITEHMERLGKIDALPPMVRKKAIKDARYDFAAALDRRRHGGTTFGDGGDLSGSGGAARDAGIEYANDCPTGEQNAESAEQAVGELFRRNEQKSEIKRMTCPYCKLTTYGDPCAFRLVCTRCDAEVRGGRVFSTGIGRAAALSRETQQKQQARAEQQEERQKKEELPRKVGKEAIGVVFQHRDDFYERIERVGIGGMIEEVRQISRKQWQSRREDTPPAA